MAGPVYLDYNATVPLRPEVVAAMGEALATTGNPSSVHGFGRAARRAVEAARERVAALVGARPEQVVFTSGGTEANNLALRGFDRPVLASAIEHDSVLRLIGGAETIPVEQSGLIDLAMLEARLRRLDRPALAAVMLANNETGAIQPVAEAAALAHSRGALLHCDAVQAAGKIGIDFGALGVDMLALSAHKLGGPQGIGALVVGDHVDVAPLLLGGGQERGRRAGTENVAAIVGFGVAAERAAAGIADGARLAELRDDMERRLLRAAPDARVLGAAAPRLPNTSCIAMPGVKAETQVMALDLAGIAVSAGSACSSGKVRVSHVLTAMGVDRHTADAAIRVSLGWRTTRPEVDRLIDAWIALYCRSRARPAEDPTAA